MGKSVHVVPAKGSALRWAVKVEGKSSPVSRHHTQKAAEDAGWPIARENASELVIHRPNGRIRDKDSGGNDPRRIKDKKH